jgi:hypothetical protein
VFLTTFRRQGKYVLASIGDLVHFPVSVLVFRIGCFRKCIFGIPRNTELTLFRVIPRNFVLFNTVEFRIGSYGIPYTFK